MGDRRNSTTERSVFVRVWRNRYYWAKRLHHPHRWVGSSSWKGSSYCEKQGCGVWK